MTMPLVFFKIYFPIRERKMGDGEMVVGLRWWKMGGHNISLCVCIIYTLQTFQLCECIKYLIFKVNSIERCA